MNTPIGDERSRDAMLRAKIMRRVWGVYFTRRLFALAVPQLVLLSIGTGLIVRFVSVKNVLANMPSIFDIAAITRFFAFAVEHTEITVQLAILLSAIGFAWLLARLVAQLRFSRLAVA